MDAYEVLIELAPKAFERVSHIATALGALGRTKKPEICGRLGGELLIAADHLSCAGPEQHGGRVLKLVRDVERICSVSIRFL